MHWAGTVPDAILPFGQPVPYYFLRSSKVHEFNGKLQQNNQNTELAKWDELIADTFDDDATLSIEYFDEEKLRKYSVHRQLIPKFFQSLYDGGASKVYFVLSEAKENLKSPPFAIEFGNATMISHYTRPVITQVFAEGTLMVGFSCKESTRLRSWTFRISSHNELIPKSIFSGLDLSRLGEVARNITEFGLCAQTVSYLKNAVILESMQELMFRQKVFGLTPRDALKSVIYERCQARFGGPDFSEPERIWTPQPSDNTGKMPGKRKKKKSTSACDGKTIASTVTGGNKKRKAAPSPFVSPTAIPDLMLVGEPALMGSDFGERDERVISRLENADVSASERLDVASSLRPVSRNIAQMSASYAYISRNNPAHLPSARATRIDDISLISDDSN